MRESPKSQIISTQLRQIAEQAKRYPDSVFTSLCHFMDVCFLEELGGRDTDEFMTSKPVTVKSLTHRCP